jgi:CPA2 family monovalent cation:H+ antiporter-2
MAVLVMLTYGMYQMGLPAPMGAFFAGLAMSGNRISVQVDALILPFREIFAAIFFVSLGLLFDPMLIRNEPVLIVAGLIGVIGLKWLAAAVAVRLTRLSWRSSFGVGMGLAHIGEFAFVLGFAALQAGLIERVDYQRLLIFALGSLLITPQMIRIGMRWGEPSKWPELPPDEHFALAGRGSRSAIVVGIGPVGQQVMNRLEERGIHTCAIDLSPVNLHALAMQGLRTVAGDARAPHVLKNAGAEAIDLAVICVPDDDAAVGVVSALRTLNKNCMILVRCRYLANTSVLEKAGANQVISEEAQASSALLAALGHEPGGPQDIVPG